MNEERISQPPFRYGRARDPSPDHGKELIDLIGVGRGVICFTPLKQSTTFSCGVFVPLCDDLAVSPFHNQMQLARFKESAGEPVFLTGTTHPLYSNP